MAEHNKKASAETEANKQGNKDFNIDDLYNDLYNIVFALIEGIKANKFDYVALEYPKLNKIFLVKIPVDRRFLFECIVNGARYDENIAETLAFLLGIVRISSRLSEEQKKILLEFSAEAIKPGEQP